MLLYSALRWSWVEVSRRGVLAVNHEQFVDTRGPSGQEPPLEVETGMGMVPEAIDMAVRLMVPGEVSHVRSSAAYAYDSCQQCREVEPISNTSSAGNPALVGFRRFADSMTN